MIIYNEKNLNPLFKLNNKIYFQCKQEYISDNPNLMIFNRKKS